mgnify:CR=1 FL=1
MKEEVLNALQELWEKIVEFFKREDVRDFIADHINDVVSTMIRVAASA